MADYEHMADGYKAHLFEWDGKVKHLIQCGCWICNYHKQKNSAKFQSYDNSDIGIFNRGLTAIKGHSENSKYWGDSGY